MVRLTEVWKHYDSPATTEGRKGETVQALRGISLEIARGSFTAVMGPSGCGKSTLLHLLGGLDLPTRGEVWVDGQAIHQLRDRELSVYHQKQVGVVFQFFNLLPQLTVMENVGLPLHIKGIPRTESLQRSREILAEVGLQGKEERLPAELSGGEQQRVAIARALIHQPALFLADEPTGNLDSNTSMAILETLKTLQKKFSLTLVLVTHSQEVANQAGRIVRMQDGGMAPDA